MAQPAAQRVDSLVAAAANVFMRDSNRVGLSVGIISQKTKFTFHYGQTAPSLGVAPTDSTVYEIGSLTKTFTGLLVAHAIKEGKLTLNDDIRHYLPGSYPNLQYPNGDPVKLGYLLAHTAQFPNSFSESWNKQRTETRLLDELHSIKLDTLRPFSYRYSNAGYQLVGYMLEKLYKTSYENLVKQYIIVPLQMSSTGISFTGSVQRNVVNGHNAAHQVMAYQPTSFPAAGSLKSTLTDMLSYLYYQLAEGDEAVKLTHRVWYGNIDENAHGFQWEIGKKWNWDYYLRGDGGTDGFRSFCVLYPDYKLGIILLTNETDEQVGQQLYTLAETLFRGLKTMK